MQLIGILISLRATSSVLLLPCTAALTHLIMRLIGAHRMRGIGYREVSMV